MPLFITAWFENGLMRHVFQKNPTVEPIRVEGLQPFARYVQSDLAAQYVEQIEEWQHPSTTKKRHSRPWNWRSYCMVDNHWLDISRAPGGLKTTTRTPWLELGLARIGLSYV